MSDVRVRVTFAGSGDASGSGGRFQACLHIERGPGPPFLILDDQFARRTGPLVVAGPRGPRQRLTGAMEVFYPGSTGVRRKFDVDVAELCPDRPIRVTDIDVRAWKVDHPRGAPASALRLNINGVVVAHTGDTAWTEAIPRAAAGADLLVAEAYILDTLNDHRNEVDCERIVVTPMPAGLLANLEHAVFETAHDDMTIELSEGARG
ncbi:hypothetical protein KIPE111705_13290 [Kibdelosporangium persicum]|uniref:MBL fold metallo-hydrolase n=1 Tax=Kibdelosporangium persicum TaxID=2698649 RepID=A0ABX2F8E6_9PSEU|nr:hypothetical protein [Kibdelosporangium persicum]NRN67187.1 MBL fold metallo-hydrolase [Kibdelosporangium persicum]